MNPPRTPTALAMFVGKNLQTKEICRVYSDILSGCWPEAKDSDTLERRITDFAAQNRVHVEFRAFGNLGVAAEFKKHA